MCLMGRGYWRVEYVRVAENSSRGCGATTIYLRGPKIASAAGRNDLA